MASALVFCSALLGGCDRIRGGLPATVTEGTSHVYRDKVREQRIGPRHDLTLRELLVVSAGTDSVGDWALGKPRAVAEANDGSIYVLDSDWKHVFLFDSTGALRRRIGGGYGAGADQMLLPVDMAAYDGHLHVLDYELNRVIVFDGNGPFDRVIQLGDQGRNVAATASGLWIRLMHPRQGRMVDLYDWGGEQPVARVGVHETDSAYHEAGVGGNIGTLRDGGIAYVHGSGAFLQFVRTHAEPRVVPVGPPSDWKYEEDPPPGLEPMYLPREVTYGVIEWGSDRVMVLSREINSPEARTTLTLIDNGGAVVAEGIFAGLGEVLSLDAGADPSTVFLTFLNPPKVVKYQVDIRWP
ncbi:MAG: hypothetical protein OXK74_06025 [Gemmatimonadota bacterium]|nr:hypothetical protein [Gemmatimonadota bacterium]